ncbi:ABC1-domain-containing protein [Sodiomyces alkalinus F11]|uniref:ABC1-domain-containing protein n=1 Tax=Sodiomyces alkalinus (strain CBS 110278 / VKM F-3762 / F11) TaxID=1314773 RepID=A0A3N2Q226_SODAK|nr:ABC1-domain-containing protein [Sodiomyces alkalinus F11]ROT40821.1 ABC1-domain-containing protein [Sodiomyces alkalinus F11]
MRFADFAIDLAAVVSASRSVAAKHIALRGRQLENFSKTSSLTASLRTGQNTGQNNISSPSLPSARGSNTAASAVSRVITKQPTATQSSPVTHVPHSSPAQALNPKHGSGLQPDTGSVLSQLRETTPSSSQWTDASSPELKSRHQTGLSSQSDSPAELDSLPPGVNVDIFHTKRGANLLGDLRKREKPKPKLVGLPEFVTHPNRQPSDATATTPSAPSENVPIDDQESARSATTAESTASVGHSRDTSESRGTTASASASASASPEATSPSPPASARPTYVLRESKVPATRIGRLWNYGGLAAGMMGGAISESIGRAFGGEGQGSVMLSAGNMERLVSKLSQMRGAALKMGQMLSFQDSKMLPGPIQEVMQRVQDRADYMPSWQRDKVLAANLGPQWRDLFEEFEEKPIAAASIGQVHRAVLKEGSKRVAVKIQFPGVADSINSDLDNLSILLTATKLLPRGLYLNKTIDNARLELGWECDYEREATCLRRYREFLADEGDTFVVPGIYPQACGKQVLTMDFMDGIGVTRVTSFTQEQRDWIGTQILRLCLREITEFRFMQTDPNWTNFLYNEQTTKLELLDFGASREYPEDFVAQYVQLLAAASRSDREAVRQLSQSLGYLTGHESRVMVEAHVDSVLTLAEPFLRSAPEVYDFEDQTITERVKALIPVMLRERLAPPPEETYSLHRKLSGAFLLCARLGSRVRCREMFENSLKKMGSP